MSLSSPSSPTMSSHPDSSPSTETHRAYHVLPGGAGGGGGIGGLFTFRLEPGDNDSFVVSFVHDPRRSVHQQDDVGALYYVIAVILIYGCSILMMIASYIRKNKVDRRLNRYLKEMANVRKRERRMALVASSSGKNRGQSPGQAAGQRSVVVGGREKEGTRGLLGRSASPSPNLEPSGQESPGIVQASTSNGSPTTEQRALPAGGFPFPGVDRRRRWPGLLLLPTTDRHHHHQQQQQRPNSPVRGDYEDSEDSEANNSYRYGPRPPTHRHPVKGGCPGRKSVKLCVPVGRGVLEPPPPSTWTNTSAGRCSDQGCSAAEEFGFFSQQDSPNSSDCRSDEDCSQKSGWNDIPTVSNV